MVHEDWKRVEDLFHATCDLTVVERSEYLSRECAGENSLRAEVETLLAAFDAHHGFMEQPAFSLGMKLLNGAGEVAESLVGRQVGTYRIMEPLGKGGMGEVYLAEDTRLGRKVALKFISHKMLNGVWGKRQLMKEAQAIAKLDHPNICAVYGFEEGDGRSFMVMQYVEGETLDNFIRQKRLYPERTSHLAVQIAGALAEAHDHGIIHRDIKPQNIMVTTSGQVKVLDFGVAKFIQQRQNALNSKDSASFSSDLGLVVGTVAYMSPEQLRAERLDFRSDIFSFGIVLYQMITGKNPYARESNADTISAILTSDPTSEMKASEGLLRIAQKCLRKDPEQRYQSANEILLDLDNLQKGVIPSRPLYSRLRAHAAFAFLLLSIVVGAFVYLQLTKAPTLAVLPIVNKSSNSSIDYLSDGLTESLINRLSRLTKLRVKAPTLVSAYKGKDVDPKEAGRALKVDTVLIGTITQEDEVLVLQTNLINTKDGRQLWRETYRVKPADFLSVNKNLSDKIAAELQLSLNNEDKNFLAKRQTIDPEAFRLYLHGRHYWNKRDEGNIKTAIRHFEQAIELDPAYAQAYAGLADCYVLMNTVAFGAFPTKEVMTKAKYAANQALEIDNSLCEAHTALGLVKLKYDWDFTGAENDFKRAIELNPDYAQAHYWLSNLLALMEKPAESLKESEIARDLDPFSQQSEMNLGRALIYDKQYDRAITYFNKMLEKDPKGRKALYMLSFIYLNTKQYDKAIELLEKLQTMDRLLAASPLGYAYGKVGKTDQAKKILDELNLIPNEPLVDYEKAIVYLGLNDPDRALNLLQTACQGRFPNIPFIKIEPVFNDIRLHPKYAELLRCAQLSQ